VDADIGLMTHFASSDEFDGAQTRAQLQAFAEATAALAGRPVAGQLRGDPGLAAGASRSGFARAARCMACRVASGKCGADFGLRPAMTLSSRLIAVNRVARGEPVGYSATWHCPEDMPWA
jgi:alanine racemase